MLSVTERCVNAAAAVLGASQEGQLRNFQQFVFQRASPKLSVAAASLSHSARELRAPHGVCFADFLTWALGHHASATWLGRLSGAMAYPLLALAPLPRVAAEDVRAALKVFEDGAGGADVRTGVGAALDALRVPGVNGAALRERVLVTLDGAQERAKSGAGLAGACAPPTSPPRRRRHVISSARSRRWLAR